MNRRTFNTQMASAMAFAAMAGQMREAEGATSPMKNRPRYIMLVHPDMVMMDLVGPATAFALTMGELHYVWKTKSPVSTDLGLPLTPTNTFDDCPRDSDVLFVPGGLQGTTTLMEDQETLDFLRDRAAHARFVTADCSGPLVLGAAGLLKGKKATALWYVKDLLPIFGAEVVEGRVVEDGNLLTSRGATAGIDLGLTLAAKIRDEAWVRKMMLTMEYAPEPPFDGGRPETELPEHVEAVRNRRGPKVAAAKIAAERAAKRL